MEPRIGPESAAPTSSSTSPSQEKREGLIDLNRRLQELAQSQKILNSYLQAHPQGFPREMPENIKLLIEKHFGLLGSDVLLSPDIVRHALDDIRRQLEECQKIYPETYHRSKPPHEPTLQPLPSLLQDASSQTPLKEHDLLAKIMSHLDPHDRESVSLVNREWAAASSIAFKNREAQAAENLIDHIMDFLKRDHTGAYSPILDRLAALRNRIAPDLQTAEKQQADAVHGQGSLMAAMNQVFERLGDDMILVLQSLGPDIRRSLNDAWEEREVPYAFGSDFLTRTDFLPHSSYPTLPSQEEVEKAFTDTQAIPMTQTLERLVALGEVSKKWLLRGEFRRAFDVALLAYRTTPNEPFRGTPLRQVFEKIALFGGIERALAFLNEIQVELDPEDLESMRAGILMNFRPATDQEIERAYSLAKEIPHSDREIPMTRLVSLAMQRKNYAQAQKIVTEGGSTVPLFFIKEIARKGDYDQAKTLIRSIFRPEAQEKAFKSIAVAMVQRGDYTQVETMIKSSPARYPRGYARGQVAIAMAQRGDYREAETVSGSITDTDVRDEARVNVASAMAQRGDYREAEAVIRSITNTDVRDQARVEVASAMAQRGDYREAETVIRSMTNTFEQNRARVRVASAMAQRGDYPQAEDAIGTITEELEQFCLLQNIVITMAQRGDYTRVMDVIRSITSPWQQDMARTEVAKAMAERGDYSQAETVIGAIPGEEEQDCARERVARAIVQRGDYREAEAVIRYMTMPKIQNRARENVAIAMAQRGDYTQAEAVIRAIPGEEAQVFARKRVARAMAERGDWAMAKKYGLDNE